MMSDRWGFKARLRLAPLGVAVWLGGACGGPLLARGQHFVLRDGRKIAMTRSETELGLVFRTRADAAAGKTRLGAKGLGSLKRIPGAEHARGRILVLDRITASRRLLVARDPGVEVVGRVYRYAGCSSPAIATGRVALKTTAGLTEQQLSDLWRRYGLKEATPFRGLHDVYLAQTADPQTDELALCERLVEDAQVRWAHPDFIQVQHRRQAVPADPLFSKQWHLDNTGQTRNGLEDADIDAPEAWLTADGQGVRFGMFDDACDVDHEDLSGNFTGRGHDIRLPLGDPNNTDPRPLFFGDFHGTSVMGLMVAAGNSVGLRGVSFRSTFTASRGLGFGAISAIASAYTFALEQSVDVHNNSWGLSSFLGDVPNPPLIEEAIETAFLEGRDLDGPGGADPLGMVIVFAAGNGDANGFGVENIEGFELSTLPTVIGVGATDDRDRLAVFSNFGRTLDVVAPGAAEIATTDLVDGGPGGDGQNRGGQLVDPVGGFPLGVPQIDADGNYTGFFNGTSAACPIVAGVAGLVLSVNPQLTATDVRLILIHTADRISPSVAQYNGITSHSFTYGFGRVNAARAVEAAQQSLSNGNLTWPQRPTDVTVRGSTVSWNPGPNTEEFLVVQSRGDFAFTPEDGACYDARQRGCAAATLQALPAAVSVFFVGCNGECTPDTVQQADFEVPEFGRVFFAIYGRSSIDRYSFGVAIDSTSAGTGGDTGGNPPLPPAVTISASPLQGRSPLTVRFNGNAVTDVGIDGNRTTWDFDIDDGVPVDATTAQASHTYVVDAGQVGRFTARLTMVDVLGGVGQGEVQISVEGPESGATGPNVTAQDISMAISSDANLADVARFRCAGGASDGAICSPTVNTCGLDANGDSVTCQSVCETELCGESPFMVQMSVTSPVPPQTVFWDLGDGTTAASPSLFHTYDNKGAEPIVVPVTVNVSLRSSGDVVFPATRTRLISVLPGSRTSDIELPPLPGTMPLGGDDSPASCGALGLLPLLSVLGVLSLHRRRR